MTKKLFLLDAYALIYRSYYAFIKNPRINSKGLNTSAPFGFTLTLDEILRKEKPSHIAVVFDPPSPTFRHEMFPAYKAQRPPMPEDLRASVPYVKQIIEAFQIPILEVKGFEADDVIGTVAHIAAQKGFSVFMMTPDKDFAQLVEENIKMMRPRRSGKDAEIVGLDEVRNEFQVKDPKQVIDVLALWGDAADNIPGAPGIGEKTAKKLISEYGSIDNVYLNLDKLKPKQKENLINFKDQVMRARELVTIIKDVPVRFNEEELSLKGPDFNKVRELFDTLEFKALANRILADHGEVKTVAPSPERHVQGDLFSSSFVNVEETIPTEFSTIKDIKHDYKILENDEDIAALSKKLNEIPGFCFDTETTSLDSMEAELVGLAISYNAKTAYYIPFPEDRFLTQNRLELIRPALENSSTEKIGQNIKYDLQVLKNYNIEIKGYLFDTMIAHYLLQPDRRHNLNELAENYLSYKMVPIESLIGPKGKNQKNMRQVSPDVIREYAGEDADITYQLKEIFEKELEKHELMQVFKEVEMPLIPVLADMERTGIKMEVGSLKGFAEDLRNDILALEKEILDYTGFSFNISSPKQLGEVLFDHLKIDPLAKKTKSGQYSTGEEVLVKLKSRHPIISNVLEFRGLKKLLNTYVDALPELIKKSTGKIHTSFKQAVAATGRLSSVNPNLQNIPIREARGRELRKAFVPSEKGSVFLSADYSQVELRLMAHMSGDENMKAAFIRNEDIHTATAALINGVSLENVDREMRTRAKTANFGIIYGISSFGLSQRLNIPRKEAKALIDGYFRSYPKIKEFMDANIQKARDNGYVSTIMGRRRYLADIQSQNSVVRGNAERNAINAPVQGSAADLIKIAMIRIFSRFSEEKLKSKMLIQVHDELNFEVPEDELNTVRNIVRDEMENAFRIDVPLVVDIGEGQNWFEAH